MNNPIPSTTSSEPSIQTQAAQPNSIVPKKSSNKLLIALLVIIGFLLIGICGYYFGSRQSITSIIKSEKQNVNPSPTLAPTPTDSEARSSTNNLGLNSPTSSPTPTDSEARPSTNNLTAWRHETGYFLLNLPSLWSAQSSDGGACSEIGVYAEPVRSEESQRVKKDLVMTFRTCLSDQELTSNNVLIWKEENEVLESNTLILDSQKGSITFSISYPKNTNYKDQIIVILDNLNFKASPEELSKAKTIP